MTANVLPNWWKYRAIAVIFVIMVRRDDFPLPTWLIVHERIHFRQQREMLYLPFFLWYGLEFLVRFLANGMNWDRAYRSISFEREAYSNQYEKEYLKTRKLFAWWKYLKGDNSGITLN